jgi:hypothetical protein
MRHETKAYKEERDTICTLLRAPNGARDMADNARLAEFRRVMRFLEGILSTEMVSSPYRHYWPRLRDELVRCRLALGITFPQEDKRARSNEQARHRNRQYRIRKKEAQSTL